MSKTVEVTFTGVETPKRQQNAEDEKRGIVRHTFDVPARNVSADVLIDLNGPNPRKPNPRKKAAKALKESLMGSDKGTIGSFHLAHSGIRGLVDTFEKVDDTTYRATFEVDTGTKSEDHGIANGLHTIAVIKQALQEGEIPPEQYLTFTLVENVERQTVPYVARGLNTNIQVSEESILNLDDAFAPFKAELATTGYASEIGWHENDDGNYDARDVYAVINALDVIRYPNDDKEKHPIESYEKQSQVIARFSDEFKEKGAATTFHAAIPILKEALFLYDTIRNEAGQRYRDASPNGKPGGLAIMEAKTGKNKEAKQDAWEFPFISDGEPYKRGTYRLANGVTYAMLAAFRNFVEVDPDSGEMRWAGGFDTVLEQWRALGGDMMQSAVEVSKAVNYNPNAVGKNRPFWRQLHQTVGFERLQRELTEMKANA